MHTTKWLILIIFVINISSISAQNSQHAAVIDIIGDEVYFIRANTEQALSLSVGAIAPFGIDDTIRTGSNGRVLITIAENQQILLLPNSSYRVEDYGHDEVGNLVFVGALQGIAIHIFDSFSVDYQLQTENFEISAAGEHFAVWAIDNGLSAVTSAVGEVRLQVEGAEYIVTANHGFATPYSDEAIALNPPLHAAQVVGLAVDCQGLVVTNGSQGLRLRAGAALDYLVVDILQDGQTVKIVGTTENGLWYRIPFQTGFGWIYSSLIEADCANLERFPNLVGELPERINDISEFEIVFVEPFYGTRLSNSVFYR